MAVKRPRAEIIRHQERRARGPERWWHWTILNGVLALFLIVALFLLEQALS